MQHLFIYIGENQRFDPEKIIHDFHDIPGTSNINGPDFSDARAACDYEFDGYKTFVRLEGDPTMIVIDSVSDAAFQMALELQKRDLRPLRVITDTGGFHFSIKGINSLAELKRKVNESYFDDEAKAMEEASTAA